MKQKISTALEQSSKVLAACTALAPEIESAVEKITGALEGGKKVILMGNGGSATQAQHIAAEFVNKFRFDRKALGAIALTADIASLTSISNDSGFDFVFSRQIEALGSKGDVAIILTTSDVSEKAGGHSKNLFEAIKACKRSGITTIGLLGDKSAGASKMVDLPICVPSHDTPNVQEAHIAIMHIMCDLSEQKIFGKNKKA